MKRAVWIPIRGNGFAEARNDESEKPVGIAEIGHISGYTRKTEERGRILARLHDNRRVVFPLSLLERPFRAEHIDLPIDVLGLVNDHACTVHNAGMAVGADLE